MKLFIRSIALSLFVTIALPLNAQTLVETTAAPQPPKPLADTVSAGAQIFYIGEFNGLNGWALIRQGEPEFYYATPDNSALVMGLLFDGEGNMITNGQLAQLRAKEGESMFAMTTPLASETATINNPEEQPASPALAPTSTVSPSQSAQMTQVAAPLSPPTPAQEMYLDLQTSNWLTFGENGRNEIFAFIDPDCPHCRQFIQEAQPYLNNNALKLRVIPIGFTAAAQARAAMLLASGNPAERLLKYVQGDDTALNAPEGISTEAVEKNVAVMSEWGFDATPIIVYRTSNGEIRIVRGRPQDMDSVMQDMQASN